MRKTHGYQFLVFHFFTLTGCTTNYEGKYDFSDGWRELVARSFAVVGKARVQKLMQLHSIRAKGRRRFKVTTDSHRKLPISPNLLTREFTVAEPNRVSGRRHHVLSH